MKALGAQYNGFCPLKKICVNGASTMGENIGDLGGLSMAYTQVWKTKYRDEALVNLIKSDPNSPAMYCANGPLRNFGSWYTAFNVKPGDTMYLPPKQHVRIWKVVLPVISPWLP